MDQNKPDSFAKGAGQPIRWRPKLAIGSVLPCHAFTDKVLLLARGEPILTAAQLERLSRDDVVLSNFPPKAVVRALRERQVAAVGPVRPAKPTSFKQELPAARAIRAEATRRMAALVGQVQSGHSPDLGPVSAVVTSLVASVGRNATALPSLVQHTAHAAYIYTHSINTCIMSVMLAQHSGLETLCEPLGLGALLHDIGKLRLPETLLQKPTELGDSEWSMVKQHPLMGLEIVAGCHGLAEPGLQAIGEHHERLDGSGYPYGLRHPDISCAGRLLAIVDVYDAMTSEQPYHRAVPPPEAAKWILRYAGSQFDPTLVRAFVDAMRSICV